MSKARNLANLLADGAVGASELADTLDLSGKTLSLPEGVGGGVTTDSEANRPASPAVGTLFFNTTQDKLQQYTSAGWLDVGLAPVSISTISGTIYNTLATNLIITGAGFGLSATVRFSYGASTSDVVVTPDSDNQITVAVPSAVYNQVAGTSVTTSVIASGRVSNGSSKTVTGLPTGGTITSSGGYRIHTFNSSSNFVVPSGVTLSNVEYLVVAGGGGGGAVGAASSGGSGGGAGGYRCSVTGESSGGGSSAESKLNLLSDTYTVTVGSGGAAGAATAGTDTRGFNGSNSVFGSITSIGGGGGGGEGRHPEVADGLSGGSGGGGSGGGSGTHTGGAGTAGQGYAGRTASTTAPNYGCGGGGGAGGQGTVPTNTVGGTGGSAISSSITGTPIARAGGGGGGTYQGGTPGTGGGGGATDGQTNANAASNATANTGSGGGGNGGSPSVSASSGNGGSGIVIIRYQL